MERTRHPSAIPQRAPRAARGGGSSARPRGAARSAARRGTRPRRPRGRAAPDERMTRRRDATFFVLHHRLVQRRLARQTKLDTGTNASNTKRQRTLWSSTPRLSRVSASRGANRSAARYARSAPSGSPRTVSSRLPGDTPRRVKGTVDGTLVRRSPSDSAAAARCAAGRPRRDDAVRNEDCRVFTARRVTVRRRRAARGAVVGPGWRARARGAGRR